MTYQVVILPVAIADIQDVFDWYEAKQLGLGTAFIDELEKFSDSLSSFPFKNRIIKNNIRLGVLQRFPYLIYYEVVDDTVCVLSVV